MLHFTEEKWRRVTKAQDNPEWKEQQALRSTRRLLEEATENDAQDNAAGAEGEPVELLECELESVKLRTIFSSFVGVEITNKNCTYLDYTAFM